jgi:hypothetical protein
VQKHLRFEVAEEEDMAVFIEATAASAGDAHRPRRGHVAINLPIQFENLTAERFGHRSISPGCFRIATRMTRMRRMFADPNPI